MRRFPKEKTFKGSIFATFVDRDTAEAFVNDEASKTYKEKELTKLLQDEYWKVGSFKTNSILIFLFSEQGEGDEREAPGGKASQVGQKVGADC